MDAIADALEEGGDAALDTAVDRGVDAHRADNERAKHDDVLERQQRNLVPVVVAAVQQVINAVSQQYTVVHVRRSVNTISFLHRRLCSARSC